MHEYGLPGGAEFNDVKLLSQNLYLAIGLANWMDVAVDMPLYQDIIDGFENAPRALIGLLRGETFGKLLVRVAERSK